MRKIRIAQIGVGHDHAVVTFAALRRMTDVFEVVGYAEVPEDDIDFVASKEHYRDTKWAYEGAKRYTVEEILSMPDLDAVAIETFDLNLVKYAQMAADRGLHIQMDKAPGESAGDFEKLLSTVKAKGLAFNIGYMYRFNPLIRQAFERVKRGEIGKVYAIDTDMSGYSATEKREWLIQFQGGMMQYLGCHLIDLIVRLQGLPTEIISYNYATGAAGVQAKDVAFAVLKYPEGISTVKSSMLDCGGYSRRQLVIHGEKGTIEVRPLEKYESTPSGISTKMRQYMPENGEKSIGALAESEDFGRYEGLLKEFAKMVLGESDISTKMRQYIPEEGWNSVGTLTESGAFDRYEGMLNEFAKMVRGERGYEVALEEEARIHRCLLTACGIACDYKKEIQL